MVLDLLGRSKPIKTQHFMIFRHFEIILIGILMILRQILFNRLENLIFFENFLRNYLKLVYLWKISILSMNIFRAVRNIFWPNSEIFFKFWSILAKVCWFSMRNWENSLKISISDYIWARTGQNLKKNLRIWPKKNLGA